MEVTAETRRNPVRLDSEIDRHYLAADMRRSIAAARLHRGAVPVRDVRRWLRIVNPE